MKHCPQCNKKINSKAKFCIECGAEISGEITDGQKEKNKKMQFAIIALCVSVILIIAASLCVIGINNGGDGNAVTETVDLTKGFSENPDMIANAAKSVVKLNCYNEDGELSATGSGFAVFEKGVIVTNYHVIEDFPTRIELETETGEKCNIEGAVGVSKERDIAILYYPYRSTNIDIPLLSVGSSDNLKKGEKVVAIGSPLGLKNVVSTGVFSSYSIIDGATDIQFTAAISSGSSGGALFNDSGEVIGITYASIESGQNINFAVPMEFLKALWRAESKDRSELSSFYDLIIPHYTVEYVLNNYNDLKEEVFYLDYKKVAIDESGEDIIVHCTGDSGQTIKGIAAGNSYLDKKLITFSVEKESPFKCKGIGWSEYDQTPYVIID